MSVHDIKKNIKKKIKKKGCEALEQAARGMVDHQP